MHANPVAAVNWAHWWLWCLKRLAGAAFWIPLEGAAWQRAAGLSKGGVVREIHAGALEEQHQGEGQRAGRRVRFPCKAKKQAMLTYFARKNRAAERMLQARSTYHNRREHVQVPRRGASVTRRDPCLVQPITCTPRWVSKGTKSLRGVQRQSLWQGAGTASPPSLRSASTWCPEEYQ